MPHQHPRLRKLVVLLLRTGGRPLPTGWESYNVHPSDDEREVLTIPAGLAACLIFVGLETIPEGIVEPLVEGVVAAYAVLTRDHHDIDLEETLRRFFTDPVRRQCLEDLMGPDDNEFDAKVAELLNLCGASLPPHTHHP